MTYLLIKAVLSAVIIVAVSEIARRNAGMGAFVESLPLIPVRGMIWLWRQPQAVDRMACSARATLWNGSVSFIHRTRRTKQEVSY